LLSLQISVLFVRFMGRIGRYISP